MIRPILAYGHSILKEQSRNIERTYPGLEQVITDMWETMHNANGCGLAAPQIGLPIRLFVVDSKTTYNGMNELERSTHFDKNDEGIMETFINAAIVHRSADTWDDEEGCLSVPGIAYKVPRHRSITVSYFDKAFEQRTRTFSGITARMIQHEYDHTEGILYLDYLNLFTRKLVEGRLRKIREGMIQVSYPMKFV